MRRITLVATLTVAVSLIASSAASAWGGAQVNSISCPEIHAKLPVQHGNWLVRATDEQGHVLLNVQVPGNAYEQVIGGLYTLDAFPHQVTVTVGNAANINDGKVTLTRQLTNCQAPVGTPGPKGDPGVGYDCTGAAVPTGGTPAMCPGTSGKDSNSATSTTTIVIHDAPKVCTSQRKYAFRVRKTYMGQRVVSVKASEPGIKVKVTRNRDRISVSWSTAGKKYTPGGVVRSMRVVARLKNGRHVRLQWLYRPCAAKDGQLNDPSAAGQGTGGGTPNAAVL